ncbi:succinylglutamate desuccinylase/aspartoacylase domain-containing protein [Rhizobium giardinii]|uniref:N-alpha-acetyl-L-2,4-diaminobutyrate deacetylase n=1 Tax=Rhizobium giardinii TaxID=56731 RepID=A0A7W8UGA7_9HYPH|nr:succinylglutamate desuccinylase/aspartoacylase family protein [Rhizobium giardinii]MBB5538733.1 N-alpha-acetyl-L-2,4-diaminobutyrate deacetylase [Rhizobium giardinii]
MTTTSKVSTDCDYGKIGKQFSYLDIPHSGNESAWGLVRFPICVIKNGQGPTLLITGGSHGDEYEGPIALQKLAREIDANDIQGQIIILPALNSPAVRAATRVSPIDGVNMNRAFPGREDGSVSQILAHYVTNVILPSVDVVIDIHSGGKTLKFVPFACIHKLADPILQAKSRALLRAFDAPYCLELEEIDNRGMLDTTVEEAGKIFLATELGGGGSSTLETISIAERGIRRALCHLGLVKDKQESASLNASAYSLWETSSPGSYIHSNTDGLFEMLVELGQEVRLGEAIAQVHSISKIDTDPVVYRAKRDGIVIGRHHPGLIRQGDFLALIAGRETDEN